MAKAKAGKVTPSRRQYLDIKAQHPDAIVFFRLGDFYETFDEDAETAARELDLVLTSRPQGKTRTPMAGVPHHAAEGYIARLIAKGYKVALCEQIGTETVNGLIPREVVRVFTAGTVIEPGMLEAGNNTTKNKVKQHMLSGGYGAGFITGLMAKDVRTALEVVQAMQVAPLLAQPCTDIWNRMENELGAASDHTEMFRFLETVSKDQKQ
jgi:DNA mismatch repair ATPase MutS